MLPLKDQHEVINREINWFRGGRMMMMKSSLEDEGEWLLANRVWTQVEDSFNHEDLSGLIDTGPIYRAGLELNITEAVTGIERCTLKHIQLHVDLKATPEQLLFTVIIRPRCLMCAVYCSMNEWVRGTVVKFSFISITKVASKFEIPFCL